MHLRNRVIGKTINENTCQSLVQHTGQTQTQGFGQGTHPSQSNAGVNMPTKNPLMNQSAGDRLAVFKAALAKTSMQGQGGSRRALDTLTNMGNGNNGGGAEKIEKKGVAKGQVGQGQMGSGQGQVSVQIETVTNVGVQEMAKGPVPMVVASPMIREIEMDAEDKKEMSVMEVDSIATFTIPALASFGEVPQINVLVPVTLQNSSDLFRFFLEMETVRSPSPRYMSKQSDITPKMRTILVNWLVEVHRKFRNKQETLFLAINLLDRFLEKKAVSRSKLQLVGVGSLLIACKYEEIYAPEVNELVELTDNAYTRDEILQVECIMLNTLQFDLSVPTPFYFAQRILAHFSESEDLYHLTMYLLELCLIDYKLLKWLPSVIASSAVLLASRMLQTTTSWSSFLHQTSGYGEAFLRPCAIDIQNVLLNPDPKEDSVRKKYTNPKFNSVAMLAPLKSF